MATRGDRFTIKTKQVEVYSDFYNNFDLNPVTGFLARLTNEDSIKQSVKNLVLTRRGEIFYSVSTGSRVNGLLFEPMDNITQSAIQKEIIETLQNNEPRITNINVDAAPNEALNRYDITITYQIINIPNQTFTLNLVLSRVR